MPDQHYVSIDPSMWSGEPCINHTRVPLSCLVDRWWYNGDKQDCKDYSCTWPDVLVACWYYGMYGTRLWRRRYGGWAKANNKSLWEGTYKDVPPPPWEGQ